MNWQSRAGTDTRVLQAPVRDRTRLNVDEARVGAVVGATAARQAQRAEGLRRELDRRWWRVAEGRDPGSEAEDRR